jgi:hypothetical protein
MRCGRFGRAGPNLPVDGACTLSCHTPILIESAIEHGQMADREDSSCKQFW